MENREAKVVENCGLYYLELNKRDGVMCIPLNEDNANGIKEVFDLLILELKCEEFNYQLVDVKDNLYYQISNEYIKQLNIELVTIRSELVELGMVDEEVGGQTLWVFGYLELVKMENSKFLFHVVYKNDFSVYSYW